MEMKESKKNILKVLEKDGKKKSSKFDRMVLLLALQKIDSEEFDYDDEAVYTDDKHTLVYCLSQKDTFVVPEGVETIGEMAFRRKKDLKSVTLPNGLKKISRDAFFDCDVLDNIYIPASVTEVNGYSFAECGSLKSVTFAGQPKSLSRHAFDDSEKLMRIIVPQGTAEAFQKELHYDPTEDEYLIIESPEKDNAAKKAEKPADAKKKADNDVKAETPKKAEKAEKGKDKKGDKKEKNNDKGAKKEVKDNGQD